MGSRSKLISLVTAAVLFPIRSVSAETIYLKLGPLGIEQDFLRDLIAIELYLDRPDAEHDSKLLIARVDLNGDGRYELIVGLNTSVHCGRSTDNGYWRINCDVRIYEWDSGRWREIGSQRGDLVPGQGGDWLAIEIGQSKHHGWRVLGNDEEARTCWIEEAKAAQFVPKRAELPGYYGFAPKGQPCPK